MRTFVAILVCLLLGQNVNAQELLASVNVSTPRIQGTNRTIYTAMQKSLYEFLVNTRWTNRVYAPEERIECSFLLNITEEVSSGEFKATLQIQAQRPVYGSTYNSVLLNYVDNDIRFKFNEFDVLEYNPNNRTSNLVAIFAYYAYIVIGLDDDSFSLRGGTEAFKAAQKIVVDSQSDPNEGWKPYESNNHRNRYWMIEDMLSSRYSHIRSANYKYHRLGLDRMSERVSEGREQVYQALLDIQRIYRERPDPYLLLNRMFFDTKADEIINIFSVAPNIDKANVLQVLVEIDKGNEQKYQKIKESTAEF
ncbi:MAG: DUF4835 family protein [Prevotellaceae bacterium]|jgi:uncharacterized protein YrzB (UPF0473 family)|nr:DUF4835 family protein [Prevotellaceae bacterium]